MISNSQKDTSKGQLLFYYMHQYLLFCILIRYHMDQVTGHVLCCITHLGTYCHKFKLCAEMYCYGSNLRLAIAIIPDYQFNVEPIFL